jgi:hypothetical protein
VFSHVSNTNESTDEQRLKHFIDAQDWGGYHEEANRQYEAKMAKERAEQREGLIAKGVSQILFHLGWDNDETDVRLSRFLDGNGNVMKFSSWKDRPNFDAYCLESFSWNGTYQYDVQADLLEPANGLVGSHNSQEYDDEGGYRDTTEWYWMDEN